MKILIADDHGIVRRGLIQVLQEEYPFVVTEEASDGEELLNKLMIDAWNLVICDLNMPGRGGIETIREIRSILLGIPILVVSMFPEKQYAIQVFKAGASGFLAKETVHFDLIRAVDQVMKGKKFITPSIAEMLAEAIDVDLEKPAHELLSRREWQVFRFLVSGKSNTEIAETLALSASTISTFRCRILEKMNMRSIAELTRYAANQQLI